MAFTSKNARKLLSTRKAITVILLITLLGWLMPTRLLQTGQESFYAFQAPIWVARSRIQDLVDFWLLKSHSKDELIQAGIQLARVNAALTLELNQLPHLRNNLERLEYILELSPYENFRTEIARVIHRDINCWWHQIVIRKGFKHGIEVGNGVIFSEGIVGRVSHVFSDTSIIELTSSPRLRMAAHVQTDTRPILYEGLLNKLFSNPQGIAKGLPADIVIPTGSSLRLEASYLGGNFPEGLTLGWIDSLELSADGLFQQGIVRLPEGLTTLREVAVMIPHQHKAMPTASTKGAVH